MKSGRRTIERLELQFDGRAWGIGYAASNETQGAAIEYVLPGETVHAWTELVTIERLPPAQRHVDVSALLETLRERFARICLGLSFHVLEQRSQDVLYEWRHDGCPSLGQGAQHEISRFVKGKSGIHRVAYVARVNPLASQTREQWVKLIGQAKWAQPAPL